MTQQRQTIKIAHSPDTDDLFMFYALKEGKIQASNYNFEIIGKDIEELNQMAKDEIYDITAISVHAYAHLFKEYALTASGFSMAEKDWGPMVVCKENCSLLDLKGKRIAVPGLWTTAYLLLRLGLKDFQPIVIPAEQILEAVQNKEVDAGLIIHEGQIQYKEMGLHQIHKVIDTWKNIAGDLPLPLGASAVKQALGQEKKTELARLQKESIVFGKEHYEDAKAWVLKQHPALTNKDADQYLSWYVNDRTVDLGTDGEKALGILFDKAFEAGIIDKKIEVEIVR